MTAIGNLSKQFVVSQSTASRGNPITAHMRWMANCDWQATIFSYACTTASTLIIDFGLSQYLPTMSKTE
jgi:hypothetical protein